MRLRNLARVLVSREVALGALLSAAILTSVTWTYWEHFDNGFAFDDFHTIVNNAYIRDIGNVPRFFHDTRALSALPQNQAYRPVVATLNAFDYWRAGGLDPRAFHLSIFVSFLLLGVLLFAWFRMLYRKAVPDRKFYLVAAFAVAWFMLHAVNAETINYIIARSDSFSTLMVVLGLVIYAGCRGRLRQLYLLPLVLGVLTKPTAVMLAPLVFLYALMFEEAVPLEEAVGRRHREATWRALRRTAAGFVVAMVVFGLTMWMLPGTWAPGGVSRFRYLITQGYVVLHYFRQFLVPFGLSADSDFEAFADLGEPRAWLGGVFVLVLVGGAVRLSRWQRWRPVSYGLLWFLVALVPSSSVVPLAEVLNYHRVFFPYVGLCLAGTWAGFLLKEKLRTSWRGYSSIQVVGTVGLVLFLGVHALLARQRCEVWHDDLSLWRDAAEKSEGNARAAMNYGVALMKRGEYGDAEREFKRALELKPSYPTLHVNLGVLSGAQGRQQEAEGWFLQAIGLGPREPNSYLYYSRWLIGEGRAAEALPLLRRALEMSPADVELRYLLMEGHKRLGQWASLEEVALDTLAIHGSNERATDYLATARTELQPFGERLEAKERLDVAGYLDVSFHAYNAGRFDEAIAAAQEVLALKPTSAEAFNNICAARNAQRQWKRAIEACEEAIRLQPGFELARNNLAYARANMKSASEQ